LSKCYGQVYCHYLPQLHSSDYWHSMKGHGTEVMLESTSEEKELGIWTDDKLKFTSHLGHVVAKSNRILGIINVPSYIKTLILSRNCLLHWWDPIWNMQIQSGVQNIRNMEQIEKVQRRATKLIHTIKDISYQQRYNLWICHLWYIVDIVVIWLKHINLGLQGQLWEDMNINWRKDTVTHNWE